MTSNFLLSPPRSCCAPLRRVFAQQARSDLAIRQAADDSGDPQPAEAGARLSRQAEKTSGRQSKGAEAMIWVRRRSGTCGATTNAIAMFSKGIALYPDNPKFYRHRGIATSASGSSPPRRPTSRRPAQLIKGKPG
jgi:hypothetical protein